MKQQKAEDVAVEKAGPESVLDVVRRVCKERGVTAEQVLAEIFDTLAEDLLHLLPEDEEPLDSAYGRGNPLPPSITALAFRRLLQRLCKVNLEADDGGDDSKMSDREWMNNMICGNRGNRQAAAVEVFDDASVLLAKQIAQEKWEAEVTGKGDPYPHLQFKEGSHTNLTILLPDPLPECVLPAASAKAGDAAEKMRWN